MSPAYEARGRRWRHDVTDGAMAVVAGCAVLGAWLHTGAVVLVVAGVALAVLVGARATTAAALCVVVGCAGAVLGARSWREAQPRHLGPWSGWASVVGDPTPIGPGVRVTLQVEGERFDAWLYGRRHRTLAAREAGELVLVQGTRARSERGARRAQKRHVVGRFQLEFAGDWRPGSPLQLACGRVRLALRRSAERAMPTAEAALFTGLVIGDDVRQPASMTTAFRSSGLSHLTAVSGQNISFVLAAAAPVLRRLRPLPRWAVTLALIGWFMALTRFEPSIVRAGAMAVLSATAFVLGRRPRPVRLLCAAVGLLVLCDPMLVWSVGFWLSVGATAGVCVCGPWLTQRLPGPAWCREPLAVTLGAQVGVALPSLLVFGRLPLVSVPANLLAGPVAGFVMLYGIPAGLAASALPAPLAAVVMWPAAAATRFVAKVAYAAAAVEPAPRLALAGWSLVVALTAIVLRRSRARRSGVAV